MARPKTCLYLGFGGSGSKTLAEFAELVAFHHEMGARSETNFAFLLFDTFSEDLKAGEARIRQAFEKSGSSPIVKTFCISQNFPTFNTKAAPRLQNAFLADRKDHRLDDFWWSEKNDQGTRIPFSAPRFPHSPEIGAGQAPLISTFLAWHWLDAPGNSIRDLIRNTVNDLKLRNTTAGQGQDLGLETTVIAGLAGGTGRGCWHLLSLMVSQILKDEGQTNHPVGLFFDASAFPEVLSQRPEWKMKMTINSLTGFSELVGFRRNELEEIGECRHLMLPSLHRPADPKADIINTVELVGRDTDGHPIVTSGYGPVSRAFVIFGAGRAGSPGVSKLYYQVAANVLYTRFVADIQGAGANTNEFGSVGCASFVVPVAEIAAYARRAVSVFAAKRLIETIDSEDAVKTALGWIRRMAVPGDFSSGIGSDSASVIGRVYSRVARYVDDNFDSILNQGEVGGSPRDRLQEFGRTEPNSDGQKQKIVAWVREAYRHALWTGDPSGSADANAVRGLSLVGAPAERGVASNPITLAVETLVCSSGIDDGAGAIDIRGFRTKRDIVDGIVEWLDGESKRINGMPVDGEEDPRTALKAYDEAVKGFSTGISPTEKAGILREIRGHYLAQCSDTIRDAIGKEYEEAARELRQLSEQIGEIIKIVRDQIGKDEAELAQRAREVFWSEENFDRILAGDAGNVVYSTSILAETKIAPVYDVAKKCFERHVEGAIGKSGGGASSGQRNDAAGGRTLQHAVADVHGIAATILRHGDVSDRAHDREGLRAAMQRAVRKIGARIEIGMDVYRRCFSFRNVVGQHLDAWHGKWHELNHAPLTQRRLERGFQKLFGSSLPKAVKEPDFLRNPDGVREKAVDDLCLQMAVQIGHRCDVLVTQLADDSYAIDRAAVVLPAEAEFGEDFVKRCEHEATTQGLFKDHGFKAYRTYGDASGAVGDPYSMFGYASEDFELGKMDDDGPLSRVKSLTRQYEGNPDVLAWLAACENPNGESVFAGSGSQLKEADKSFGLGYSFPFWVTDERMKKCRWRPWAREAEKRRADEEAKAFVIDATLFALLSLPSNAGNLSSKLRVPGGKAATQGTWSMGILAMPAPGSAFDAEWSYRRPAYRESQGKIEADNPAFGTGETFRGILKLDKELRGDARAHVDAIAGEAAIFFGRALPEVDTDLSPNEFTKQLFEDLKERLRAVARGVQGEPDMTKRAKEMIETMIARCDRLKGKTCQQLAEHFTRRI